MRLIQSLFFALFIGSLAHAQPMTGEQFESYVEGKTLYFASEGVDYGAEDYLSNRRVRWSFLDGECQEGYWYEAPETQICFVYDKRPDDPQCWTFEQRGGGLIATFTGESGRVLYEARRTDAPLMCLGPEVGV
ncbi:MAG: hypothetical protein MK098_02095 [Marinovum sp.]|nr:hypothetical protein [Marinovum sp.]